MPPVNKKMVNGKKKSRTNKVMYKISALYLKKLDR